jgi:hypothetical protein
VVTVMVIGQEVVRVEAWNSVGSAPEEKALRDLVSPEALNRER